MSPSLGSCLIFTPAVVVVVGGIAVEGAPAPGAGPALSPGDPRPPPGGAPAPFTRGPGLLPPLPPPQSASSVLPLSMRLALHCSESGGRSRSGGGDGDIRSIFSCSTVLSISVLYSIRGLALCVSHCVVRTVCCVREESCSLYERHISTAPLHTASCYLIPLHYISSRRAMPTAF